MFSWSKSDRVLCHLSSIKFDNSLLVALWLCDWSQWTWRVEWGFRPSAGWPAVRKGYQYGKKYVLYMKPKLLGKSTFLGWATHNRATIATFKSWHEYEMVLCECYYISWLLSYVVYAKVASKCLGWQWLDLFSQPRSISYVFQALRNTVGHSYSHTKSSHTEEKEHCQIFATRAVSSVDNATFIIERRFAFFAMFHILGHDISRPLRGWVNAF